jgi:NitT/TauT family transport system ATP-binding protein
VSKPPVIQVSNVSITFDPPNREPVLAVDNVSLTVPEVRIVVIVGRSGCGKSRCSTWCRALLQPSALSVLVKGSPVTKIRTDAAIRLRVTV